MATFILFIFVLAIICSSTRGNTVIESIHVHTSIRYRFARTTFTTVVRNMASSPNEVNFAVAMPKSAYISDFNMETGGKTYLGEIKERTVVSHSTTTTSAGQQLKSSKDSNKFAVSLMAAGGDNATFTLTYSDIMKRKHGVYELLLHLNPGQAVKDFLVNVFILENTKLKSIKVPALRGASYVQKNTEEAPNSIARIDYNPASNAAHILFPPTVDQQGSQGLAHTFVVQYDVEHNPNGDFVLLDGYFIHFFAPDLKPLPKDIVFVLDVSGSMLGDKMNQMKDAMNEILGDLLPNDRFSIVAFSWWAYSWSSQLVSVDTGSINVAKSFVWSLVASGGTNIPDGILTGRRILNKSSDRERVRMIFFLTDGQNRSPISDDPSIAIYGLAFGDDADLDYVKSLSAVNGGFSKKIYVDLSAASQVEDFYNEVSRISMKDIKFVYQPGSVEEDSLTQTDFPVLFEGSEIIVMGKIKSNATHFGSQISLAGQRELKQETKDIRDLVPTEITDFSSVIASSAKDIEFSSIEKAWAFATVQQMLAEDEKKATVKGDTEILEKILELSVKHKFVTPLTSIVVDDPVKGGQLLESAVQNEEEKQNSRNVMFLQSRPPTTTVTTTTTTTTTKRPWCRPKASIDEALKSTFLMQTNLSRLVEMCIGTTQNSYKYLRKAMNVTFGPAAGIQTQKNFNDQKEESHRIYLKSLAITDGSYWKCWECDEQSLPLAKDSTYTLVRSSVGSSLYLLTGVSKRWGAVTPERIFFNSSRGQVATVFLGTTVAWRITGDADFRFQINGSFTMKIVVEDIEVILDRIASSLAVMYYITVKLERRDHVTYKGILADRLTTNSKMFQPTVYQNIYEIKCPPFVPSKPRLNNHRIPPRAFLNFYLDFILDLKKNLPVHLYE